MPAPPVSSISVRTGPRSPARADQQAGIPADRLAAGASDGPVTLGANGPVTEQDVAAALAILGPNRVPVPVTYLEPGFKRGPDTALRRQEPRRHPERVVVLDWVGDSAGHPGWCQPDGLHLTFPGAAADARFLARAIPLTKVPATPGLAVSALGACPTSPSDFRRSSGLRPTAPPHRPRSRRLDRLTARRSHRVGRGSCQSPHAASRPGNGSPADRADRACATCRGR